MLLIDGTPIDSSHRYRGIGTYAQNLIAALARSNAPEHRVLRLSGPQPTANSVSVWRPKTEKLQWLTERLLLPGELRRAQVKVYHCTDPVRNAPVPEIYRISTLYDLIPLTYPERYLAKMGRDGRRRYAWMISMLEQSDELIAISEFTKTEFVRLRGYNPNRIRVIPLGYNSNVFNLDIDHDRVASYQQEYGQFVVYSGSLEPHKNLTTVLTALTILSHPLNFVITGHAPDGAQLEQFYRQVAGAGLSGRVKHIGFVSADELPYLYRAALAFVFPSFLEGFGLPVLDAMACGTPVICACAASLPEVGGEAVLYFDPIRPAELAARLSQLLEEQQLRSELIKAGLERVKQFSWERTAEMTVQVYLKALAR